MSDTKSLLLYDGLCGLCDRLVRFALDRDPHDCFLFAPLQSSVAAEALARHGRSASDLDTFYALPDFGRPGERVLARGRAALHVLRTIGGAWRVVAALLGVLPTVVLDLAYDQVARRRMRLFGRLDACRVPAPRERAKFLGVDEEGAR